MYALFSCQNQLYAMQLTSFLNGGLQPDWFPENAEAAGVKEIKP